MRRVIIALKLRDPEQQVVHCVMLNVFSQLHCEASNYRAEVTGPGTTSCALCDAKCVQSATL